MTFSRHMTRLAIVIVSLVLLYTLVGFVVIPWVAKSKLPSLLSGQLDRPVLVKDIAFNPFALSLTIQGLEVQESDQSPLFGFQELFVNFQASSLFRQAYTFEQIKLVLPYGIIKIHSDGTVNVAQLGSTKASDSGAKAKDEESLQEPNGATGLPAIDIHHVSIEQGMIEFHDESRPTPFSADIVPIEISLNNFTTRPDSENPYAVTAEFSEGEILQWEGTLVLEPLSSSGKVSLTGLRLQTPWQYLQDQLRFEIHHGILNISTEYQVTTQGESVETMLSEGDLHVGELRMAAKGNTDTVLDIPSLDVKGVMVDISQQRVTIPFVRSKDAKLVTWLNDKGKVNYQELFAPIDATERAARVSDVTPNTSGASSNDSADSDRPWVVEVQDFALQNYTVGFADRTLEPPAKLDLGGLDLQVKGLNTTFEEPFDLALSMTLNQTGKVEAKGTLEIDPFVADLDLNLTQVALVPFQPYWSPYVQFEMVNGALALNGKTRYYDSPTNSPLLEYRGQFALSDVATQDTQSSQEFLRWKSLKLQDVTLDVEPTRIDIAGIEFTQPFVEAAIGSDGAMNLSRVFSPPGAESEADGGDETEKKSEEEPTEPLPVKIDRIAIAQLVAQFADRSLEPNVVASIQDLTGTISGLSSKQLAKADVDLKGKVGKYAPIEIKGKINPLSKDTYTDLIFKFTNLDLPTVSPYSAKYVGHPITKGKLSLDLKYKIAEHLLEGENKILVDQITMGAKTNSPDATLLPVPLALALLKDRHGKIDIDLPVRGNLNDPDFSYGGIILDALVNLLTKIVTSPFNLLGGVMGAVGFGGDELQFVEFALGHTRLREKEQEKLSALAKALEERPALRLEVTGTADVNGDRIALAEEKLVAQLRQLDKENSLSEAKLSEDDERRLVRNLFVQQFGEEAVKALETSSSVPSGSTPDSEASAVLKKGDSKIDAKAELTQGEPWERMKRQLLEAIDVHEHDVRLLAQHRGQAIRDYLIQQGKISEERVFLVEVQLNAQADEDLVRSPLTLTGG